MRTFQAQKLDGFVGRGAKKLDVPFINKGLRGEQINHTLTPLSDVLIKFRQNTNVRMRKRARHEKDASTSERPEPQEER